MLGVTAGKALRRCPCTFKTLSSEGSDDRAEGTKEGTEEGRGQGSVQKHRGARCAHTHTQCPPANRIDPMPTGGLNSKPMGGAPGVVESNLDQAIRC